jgi:hypothetical protein
MTVVDSGQQKRLLKEKTRGSVKKTERTISRVDLLRLQPISATLAKNQKWIPKGDSMGRADRGERE